MNRHSTSSIRFGSLNHNETVVVADPAIRFGTLNHNETVVADRPAA